MTKIITVVIMSLFGLTNRVYISGHFKNTDKANPVVTSNRQILLMVKNTVVAETKTDHAGYYELEFLDIYSIKDTFHLYYIAGKDRKDTLLLKSIATFSSDHPVIDLYVPKKPTKK